MCIEIHICCLFGHGVLILWFIWSLLILVILIPGHLKFIWDSLRRDGNIFTIKKTWKTSTGQWYIRGVLHYTPPRVFSTLWNYTKVTKSRKTSHILRLLYNKSLFIERETFWTILQSHPLQNYVTSFNWSSLIALFMDIITFYCSL